MSGIAGRPDDNRSASFWTRCFDALILGGCLASNWADFTVNPNVRPMAEMLAAVARVRGIEPIFVTRRGFRDNLVQYVPTAPGRAPETLDSALERFAGERHLPTKAAAYSRTVWSPEISRSTEVSVVLAPRVWWIGIGNAQLSATHRIRCSASIGRSLDPAGYFGTFG